MNNVLVLNYDYSPLAHTTTQRGFVLVHKGKAEILKSEENNPIISGYRTYVRPIIIRLLRYINYRVNAGRPSRHKIYDRDNHECAYCGSRKNLTIDHIQPKSRGGKNEWLNMITCCSTCNVKKGDRTPDEAKMKLRFLPYKPSIDKNSNLIRVWNELKSTFFQ